MIGSNDVTPTILPLRACSFKMPEDENGHRRPQEMEIEIKLITS